MKFSTIFLLVAVQGFYLDQPDGLEDLPSILQGQFNAKVFVLISFLDFFMDVVAKNHANESPMFKRMPFFGSELHQGHDH